MWLGMRGDEETDEIWKNLSKIQKRKGKGSILVCMMICIFMCIDFQFKDSNHCYQYFLDVKCDVP